MSVFSPILLLNGVSHFFTFSPFHLFIFSFHPFHFFLSPFLFFPFPLFIFPPFHPSLLFIMPHYIHLRNLHFHAFHGVMPQERTVGNDYVVNLRAEYPIEQAMQSDDVAHTLNYAEVYAVVEKEMQTPSCLLENVAHRIAQRLFRDFPRIRPLRLEVVKQNPPMGTCGGEAAVEIQLNNDKSQ